MSRSPTSPAATNQAPATSPFSSSWPTSTPKPTPAAWASSTAPAPAPSQPWPGSRATNAPDPTRIASHAPIGKADTHPMGNFKRASAAMRAAGVAASGRLSQAVLEGAAELFDQLDGAVNAGAHIDPRVELAKFGDGGVDVLETVADGVEVGQRARECLAVGSVNLSRYAHHVGDEKPGLIQVVEHPDALLDRDQQLTRARLDDANLAPRAPRP